ncbi:MAG: putative PurR-regulated permease PerM [bacterium]|jgi:predicted PurR-regulated permease PerM
MNLSKKSLRIVIASALLLFVGVLLYNVQKALLPLILAIFLAYILSPVVDKLTKKKLFGRFKVSRGFVIIMIYLVSITGLSFGGTYFVINLGNEMQILAKNIPTYGKVFKKNWIPIISEKVKTATAWFPKIEQKLEKKIIKPEVPKKDKYQRRRKTSTQEFLGFLSKTRFEIHHEKNGFQIIPHSSKILRVEKKKKDFDVTKMMNEMVAKLVNNLQNVFVNLLDIGQKVVVSILGSVLTTTIVFMMSAFMIIDSQRIMNFFRGLFPKSFSDNLDLFLERLDTGLNGVVRGQLIICLVNGTLTGVGLFLFNINFALTLSFLAAIFSLIPIFGVVLSSVPIVLMALTTSPLSAFLMLLWILGIHFIEGNFLNPKIIGKSAEIHPVLVIFALIAGERTFGLVGALLAVPLFSMLQTTFIFILEFIFDKDVTTLADIKPNGTLKAGSELPSNS